MYIGPWVFQYFLMWPPLKKVWTPLTYIMRSAPLKVSSSVPNPYPAALTLGGGGEAQGVVDGRPQAEQEQLVVSVQSVHLLLLLVTGRNCTPW